MDAATRDNLMTAMRGEAMAHARYRYFAGEARRLGQEGVAKLFEEIAGQELDEHFREEAELLGLGGTMVAMLEEAISGEQYEIEWMYEEFARQADTAGEPAAAARFREVRGDEMSHRSRLQAALESLTTRAAG